MSHYQTYHLYKAYSTPTINAKHMRKLDAELWRPGAYTPDMSCLEVGCGTGRILAYLAEKGVRDLHGIDQDARLAAHIPASVRDAFEAVDAQIFIAEKISISKRYDRILMFDVIEHFSPDEGCKLLTGLAGLLSGRGRIHLKVPNAGSPWGQQFQYGDLTHRTAYTPESMRQQALAAGLVCEQVYGQILGSPARQAWSRLVHGALDRLLTSPPEIWDGNFYAILAKSQDSDPGAS